MKNIKPFLIVMLVLSTLGLVQFANAEELYRWREADGTLTFSPTPPPAGSGIAFEKISPASGAARANPEPALVPATNPALVAQQPTRVVAASKNGHCNDLRKRVQSLERLIMTDVSNETMDNAVVQMARYQNSFNQSCRGITR
ncbi:MAG: DUF4124 domain-containing protein [Gammaproteobacteria bacterium]|nr:DUF4124 domain-containing protein [Gammaproteobacteria bacterium]